MPVPSMSPITRKSSSFGPMTRRSFGSSAADESVAVVVIAGTLTKLRTDRDRPGIYSGRRTMGGQPMNPRLSPLLVALLAAPAANAHHSFAPHFDIDKFVEIAG